MKLPAHGLRTTYNNWKCRCEQCRKANAKHAKERREARGEMLRQMQKAQEEMT